MARFLLVIPGPNENDSHLDVAPISERHNASNYGEAEMLYKAELIARALEAIKSEVNWRDTQWLEDWLWELKTEQLKSYLDENDS